MGSIVVYQRDLVADESEARYAGMIALGEMFKAKLTAGMNFRKAVRETLWEIITDGMGANGTDERTYIVQYELDLGAGPEDWFIKEAKRNKKNNARRWVHMYETYEETSPGSGKWEFKNKKGSLVLNIEIDEKLPSNVFTMSVNVPRRGEIAGSWNYFDDFLTDLEAAFQDHLDPIANKRNYLAGALTFSRCR
ncbi:MAG: hypothetical protein GY785_11610 [Gammaproteobacteria bacterium]|nr:hypothetical protein [Gammaproteobacteria bacterium]